ncbi:hypothetical protein O4J56_06040 [Nocardiopsis sp. RSe5-2]|uniref:DUF4149 domain-containing protein n=1 Tax=Nocardiopsis endophytica TaxID=3018445 RepID=A0ABT4TZR7_9ACTN|nr:hypothetical protein [Nocardiopsis endophytica]MDA2810193.1 hypothetical protein [Nocardiopsis endophytica]
MPGTIPTSTTPTAPSADAPRAGGASASVPRPLRVACLFWLVAIGAGVVESVIGATGMALEEGMTAGLAAAIALRVAVYSGAAALVLFLHRGRAWARIALTVLLGVIGFGTLVVPLAAWFAGGGDPAAALAQADGARLAYFAVRAVHIAAVPVALVAMFLPASGAYLRARSGR